MTDRGGVLRLCHFFFHRPAEEPRQDRLGWFVVLRHIGQIPRPGLVDNARHLAALLPILPQIPIELVGVAGRSQHRHQMPAGRHADGADASGIEVVFFGMRPQPADRSLAIVNLGWPDRFISKPVADRGNGILARLNKRQHHLSMLFVPSPPAAAMHEEDHRQRPPFPGRLWQIEIEPLPRVVGVGVGNVEFSAHRERRRFVCNRQRDEPRDRHAAYNQENVPHDALPELRPTLHKAFRSSVIA